MELQPVRDIIAETFQLHTWFMLQADDDLEAFQFCFRQTAMRVRVT
jgi:hypothetical protein